MTILDACRSSGRGAFAMAVAVALLGHCAAARANQSVPPDMADTGPPSVAMSRCATEASAAMPQRWLAGGVVAVRTGMLSKGVNLTDIFHPELSIEKIRNDIQRIREAGFRHVRLPISPSWVLTWSAHATPDARLRRLDDTVCAAVQAGLAVILDVHPEDDLAVKDTAAPDTVGRLAAAWDRLAGRYAVFPSSLVVFEAMNEPALTDQTRWEHEQQTLLAHIRRAAPRHTILLTASPHSTAGALAGLKPVTDGNVAYTFHFYTPMVFTHQGADWSSPGLGSVRALAYPAMAANVAAVRRSALPSIQDALASYLASDADPAAIKAEVAAAADWAAQHKVPLVVTEFGSYGAVVPEGSRVAWLADVRQALEARGIGWTVWEYRGGFGIDADLLKPCRQQGSMRSALGLCSAVASR